MFRNLLTPFTEGWAAANDENPALALEAALCDMIRQTGEPVCAFCGRRQKAYVHDMQARALKEDDLVGGEIHHRCQVGTKWIVDLADGDT
jgi:hypothetical protein